MNVLVYIVHSTMNIHFYIFRCLLGSENFCPLNIELHNAQYFYQVKKGSLFVAIEQEIAYMLFDSKYKVSLYLKRFIANVLHI